MEAKFEILKWWETGRSTEGIWCELAGHKVTMVIFSPFIHFLDLFLSLFNCRYAFGPRLQNIAVKKCCDAMGGHT